MLLLFFFVADGKPHKLHVQHLKADVIAKWQME